MGWERAEGATASAVATDLWASHRKQVTSYPRRIIAGAYVGGNAIGESRIELFVGDIYVGELANTTATNQGMVANNDVVALDIVVPANTMVHAYISKVGSVSATQNFLMFAP